MACDWLGFGNGPDRILGTTDYSEWVVDNDNGKL